MPADKPSHTLNPVSFLYSMARGVARLQQEQGAHAGHTQVVQGEVRRDLSPVQERLVHAGKKALGARCPRKAPAHALQVLPGRL